MLFYPILFFTINQRDQDHLRAELGYSFLAPPQNVRWWGPCAGQHLSVMASLPILLFSQWSWTSPLDTETKQIRSGYWKIRVNPTGKKKKATFIRVERITKSVRERPEANIWTVRDRKWIPSVSESWGAQ